MAELEAHHSKGEHRLVKSTGTYVTTPQEKLWNFVLLSTALHLSKAVSSTKYIISGFPERNLNISAQVPMKKNSFTDNPCTNFRNS